MRLKREFSWALAWIIIFSFLTVTSAGSLSNSESISIYGTIATPAYQIMLGAWLGESALSAPQLQTAIPEWEVVSGKGLAWYDIMSNFGTPTNPAPMGPIDEYKPLIQQGLFKGLIYTWQPSHDWDWDRPYGTCTSQIASGMYNAYIHQEAIRCKNAGYPIIIRWGHEMNTYWAGWAINAENYKQAWINIVSIFRSEGASNVKFFWCPNYNDNPTTTRFQDYYPGDQYVDFVGTDLYSNNDWGWWADPEKQLGNPSQNVYDAYPNKPFIIGEWGCSNILSDQQNADWVNRLFTAVETRDRIIIMVHWRGNQDGWRVDQYPQALSTFKNRIADDLYTDNLTGWS